MSLMDSDALFSLELVVDRLVLDKKVACRFPAVAFRLLDFPTLLVHLVDPSHADVLRAKLAANIYGAVPPQLPELLDWKNGGGFTLRSGKSCLFRVSPNSLQKSLSQAPLYVMVVDTYHEVPKLVGSCTLPLDSCMNELYNEISARGLSLPTVCGDKCELDVYNLMGAKLGTISLGYRLLSLGIALLSHIPDSAVATLSSSSSKDVRQVDSTSAHYCTELDNEPAAVAARELSPEADNELCIPVSYNHHHQQPQHSPERRAAAAADKVDGHTQVDVGKFETVATQTSKRKGVGSRQQLFETTASNKHVSIDEGVVTNMTCPPPLFYHSQKPAAHQKVSLYYRQHWSVNWRNDDDNSEDFDDDDDGTIRPEDKSEDDSDDYVHVESSDTHRRYQSKQNRVLARQAAAKIDPCSRKPAEMPDLSKFPVLNALLFEVLRLQGMHLAPAAQAPDETPRYKVKNVPKSRNALPAKQTHVPASVRREPRVHRCAEAAEPIPKDVSWIGQRSAVVAMAASSLTPGMTETQRLRLKRTNPRLLKDLEMREAQRRNEFRAAQEDSKLRQKHSKKQQQQQQQQQKQQQFVPTEAARRNVPAAAAFAFGSDFNDAVDGDVRESMESPENTARRRRPVPTPRTSKMNLFEKENTMPPNQRNAAEFVGTKTYSVMPRTGEPLISLRSSSEEKIQLSLPAVHEDVKADYADDRTKAKSAAVAAAGLDRPSKLQPDMNKTRVLSAPDTTPSNVVVEQSENFDAMGTLTVEDLGLKRVVEHYSDNSANEEEEEEETPSPAAAAGRKIGSEPGGVRRVVERYSDGSDDEHAAAERSDDDDSFGGLEPQLRKIVDHEDSSGSEQEENDRLRNSTTGSVSVRSYSSGEFAELNSGRSSTSPTYGKRRDSNLSQGRALRPSPMKTSPRRTIRNEGANKLLEVEVEPSLSLGVESYSEIFEAPSDDEVRDLRSARDAKPVTEAKLGYTWA